MATQNFLAFADTASGTDIYTDAQYAADADSATGNKAGIAKRKLNNKALKQATKIGAGLAQFIANNQSNNITDATTVANLASYLATAVASLGGVVDASTTTKGKVQLATSAEAQALSDALKAITPNSLNASFQGGNQSNAVSGYQKLPGGLILQWGLANVAADSNLTVTLPIAFPNNFYNVIGCMTEGTPGGGITIAGASAKRVTSSLTQLILRNDNATQDMHWIAIGN